ncbi:isopeptide-forming domain-containing fimbrial protein [Drancourtella massiliensis]|uniref:Isopeptide-forming domain-containing fimbrial protein n=1 Tax=Drancourtella massiliensis TaxID=1632013 RepID=A0ABS2EJW3_9FIRM|nr:SpaA isopeptide-forming pilin-related protein [Drancourtella massiliensis]MBM6745263.1 isopeptide-forming domain-containing fimbrial protein [Drancourtella massiliensis]
MRKLRKVMALLMTLAMVMGLSLTAFAASAEVRDITSKITIAGLSPDVDTDIKMYRFATLMFDQDTNEYTWEIENWAKDHVTLSADKTEYTIDEGEEAALKTAAEGNAATLSVEDVRETSYTFENVQIGGYVIIPSDTNADYLPLFVTNNYDRTSTPGEDGRPVAEDVTAYAKSENHTITKSQTDDFAQIGSTVGYTINATFPMQENTQGEELTQFKITDEPTGLQIDQTSVKVMVGNDNVTSRVTIAVDTLTGVLTVDFANVLRSYTGGESIVITYNAVVTDVEYNNNATATSDTTDYTPGNVKGDTGSIQITKVDAENTGKTLAGAVFQVYDLGDGTWDADDKGTPMSLIYDAELDAYRPILSDETGNPRVTVNESGVLKIVGLDEGNYHFEEVVAPDGYSINDAGLTVTITEGTNEDYVGNFLDTKLAELPGTGGIGTTIFTIGGCVIMIAAAGLYFASRRKHGEN